MLIIFRTLAAFRLINTLKYFSQRNIIFHKFLFDFLMANFYVELFNEFPPVGALTSQYTYTYPNYTIYVLCTNT